VAALAFAIAGRASAATVVTFVAIGSGDTLVISNPQALAATGQIRLIPDTGTSTPLPVAFSIPAQGSQSFPSVLSTFRPITSPAIVAVESSDAVRLSSIPLRIAYLERPVTVPVRFNPSVPTTGALVLGTLNGLVRVNIYEHPTSQTPLVTRVLGSSDEQVTRLRYADLLPAGLTINDGIAIVTPLSGQAVGVSVNAPTRRRAAGIGPTPQPVLSITGGPACQFATGIHAAVPPVAGATYRWTLFNATAQGVVAPSVDLALGSAGYSTVLLDMAVPPSASTVEANIRIDSRPLYAGSTATSVTLGEDATISWVLGGGTPTSQMLSLSDFGAVPLDASARIFTYRPTKGTKTYALAAENACGSSGEGGSFEVSVACTPPKATSFTIDQSTVCPGASSTMRFAIADAATWSLQSALGNGLGPPSGTGSGMFTSAYIADSTAGSDVVTLTVSGACGTPATRTLNLTVPPPPVITSFTAPSSVGPGASATLTFAYTNGISYSFTSNLGNTFSPSGGDSTTGGSVIYSRDVAPGPDTITLIVTAAGPCQLVSAQQRTIN
jgi:hypothetical protein